MAEFRGRVRRWRETSPAASPSSTIPAELVVELGGRRQARMAGRLNGVPFDRGLDVVGGGFCVGVSRAALSRPRSPSATRSTSTSTPPTPADPAGQVGRARRVR